MLSENKMEKTLGIRVPESLLEAMAQAVKQQSYSSYSEYVRAAIREKLEAEKQ